MAENQMHQAIITISKVWDPFPDNPDYGTLVDTANKKWKYHAKARDHIQEGCAYEIGYTTYTLKKVAVPDTIKQWRPAGSAVTAAASGSGPIVPPASGHNQPPANGNGTPLPHSYKDLDIATQAVYKASGTLILSRNHEGEITKQMIAEALLLCEDGVKLWWRSRNKAAPTPPPAPTNIEDTF
jgi:hypothetical protein